MKYQITNENKKEVENKLVSLLENRIIFKSIIVDLCDENNNINYNEIITRNKEVVSCSSISIYNSIGFNGEEYLDIDIRYENMLDLKFEPSLILSTRYGDIIVYINDKTIRICNGRNMYIFEIIGTVCK